LSSGDEPIGEERAHPDRVSIAETIAMEAQRILKLDFVLDGLPLLLGLLTNYIFLHLELGNF
jgi:hypothetical protein